MNFDFTKNKDTRRLTKENIFFVASRVVFWKTKFQETVVISIVEVEYITFIHATQ